MVFLILLVVLVGCDPSPWIINPTSKNLTQKHLNKLTQKDPGEPGVVRFALLGDTQAVPEAYDDVMDRLSKREDLDFALIAGDLTDMGLQIEWTLFEIILNRMKFPVLTVVGNHDGLNHGKKIYKKTFGPLNYSFTFKGQKIVMWNNNGFEWKDIDIEWLETEAIENSIVVSHQPPNSGSLPQEIEERWAKIRPRLTMSLHAHVHAEQFSVTDRLYVVGRVPKYSIITVNSRSVTIDSCDVGCEGVIRHD